MPIILVRVMGKELAYSCTQEEVAVGDVATVDIAVVHTHCMHLVMLVMLTFLS